MLFKLKQRARQFTGGTLLRRNAHLFEMFALKYLLICISTCVIGVKIDWKTSQNINLNLDQYEHMIHTTLDQGALVEETSSSSYYTSTYKEVELIPKSTTDRIVINTSIDFYRNIFPCPTDFTNCSCVRRFNEDYNVNCQKKSFKTIPNFPYALRDLDMSDNNISQLDDGFFSSFKQLRILSIANNRISRISNNTFVGLYLLHTLHMQGNPLKVLPDFVFSPLVALKALDLRNTLLEDVPAKAFRNVSKLGSIFLDSNSITKFPLFVDDDDDIKTGTNLNIMKLDNNQITSIPFGRLDCISKLSSLHLDGNAIRSLPADAFRLLPNLKVLSLARNTLYHSIDIFAFRSKSLINIDLQQSGVHLGSKHKSLFRCAPKLRNLNLYKSVVEYTIKDIFHNIPLLDDLDISATRYIPTRDAFINSTNITTLKLNSLSIQQIDVAMLETLKRLRRLDLSDNRLTTINYTSLPTKLWTQLVFLDLSYNTYVCDCSVVWFRHFLRTTNVTIAKITRNDSYVCSFPVEYIGYSIKNLQHPTDIECFSSHTDWTLKTVFIFQTVVYISSLIGSLLHRFMWHVRYLQFVLQTRRRRRREMSDECQYAYDAFVIYCQEDSKWIFHELRPRLEKEESMRLCIHHRDWLIGRDIVDNITDSIESSRKCLLIVSNAFSSSQWCHFEMTMAQSRLLQEDRDNLVLVLLEEIADTNITPRLRLQMQRQTYIEWTDNVVGQQLFWARLKLALRRPDRSVADLPLGIPIKTLIRSDKSKSNQ